MKSSDGFSSFPCGKEYWRGAARELKNVRSLVLAALLSAAAIVIEFFQIPLIPGVLEVSFSFAAVSLCSFLTGPVLAIPCGIIVDIVGAVAKGYSFYFGYTLSAVLGAFIYALFLYRARLSFARIALARLTVNIFVNAFLGSVWRVAMSGGGYAYYLAISLIKNLLLLPLEVFIMMLFLEAILPTLKRLKLCRPSQQITLSYRKILIFTLVLVLGTALLVLYSLNRTEVNAYIGTLFGGGR